MRWAKSAAGPRGVCRNVTPGVQQLQRLWDAGCWSVGQSAVLPVAVDISGVGEPCAGAGNWDLMNMVFPVGS